METRAANETGGAALGARFKRGSRRFFMRVRWFVQTENVRCVVRENETNHEPRTVMLSNRHEGSGICSVQKMYK